MVAQPNHGRVTSPKSVVVIAKSEAMPSAKRMITRSKPVPQSGLDWFRLPASDRIRTVRLGLPAIEAKAMLAAFDLPMGVVLQAIGVSPATFNRKVKQGETLAPDASERIIGLAMLLGQVETMVAESGDLVGFSPVHWLSGWLQEPVPALGGQRPIDLLDTIEGQRLVVQSLGQMQSGAYA